MHAGFPQVAPGILRTLNSGLQGEQPFKGLLSRGGERMLARSMALALRLGFSLILRDGLLDEQQSRRAREFFEDNFEINDSSGGIRYYQGRFLIAIGDEGNEVLLQFCPQADRLYCQTPWGQSLDPFAVVDARVLEQDEVCEADLVIRFKDAETVLGLVGQPSVDIVGFLLQNTVRLTGNVGHLFKLGAIGADVQRLLPQ